MSLRSATSAEHAEVDRLFSAFDLSQPAGYRAFLAAQAPAYLGIERSLDSAGAGRLVDDWPQRQRAALLHADLEDLGMEPRAEAAVLRFSSDPALLGGVYVLEGSRLGGALLARSIPPGAPARFLRAPAPPGAWRSLLRVLDDRLRSPSDLELAVDAARASFGCFAQAAAQQLELKS